MLQYTSYLREVLSLAPSLAPDLALNRALHEQVGFPGRQVLLQRDASGTEVMPNGSERVSDIGV